MDDFGVLKNVEFGRGSDAVRSDVFRVQTISNLQIFGELHGQGHHVEAVAGGADHGADILFPALDSAEIWDPAVINKSRGGLIDPVADLVEHFSVSPGFSDDGCDQHRRVRHQESSRFGDHLDVFHLCNCGTKRANALPAINDSDKKGGMRGRFPDIYT